MLLGLQAKVLQEWDLLQEGSLELGPPGAAPWWFSLQGICRDFCAPAKLPGICPLCSLIASLG